MGGGGITWKRLNTGKSRRWCCIFITSVKDKLFVAVQTHRPGSLLTFKLCACMRMHLVNRDKGNNGTVTQDKDIPDGQNQHPMIRCSTNHFSTHINLSATHQQRHNPNSLHQHQHPQPHHNPPTHSTLKTSSAPSTPSSSPPTSAPNSVYSPHSPPGLRASTPQLSSEDPCIRGWDVWCLETAFWMGVLSDSDGVWYGVTSG
jgi:hypothetical protein